MFHGTADPFVPWERARQAIEEMPSTDKEVHIYEDARHDVLNEINEEEIIGALSVWIDRVAGSG